MFERLFKRPCVRARHRQGPLSEERRIFLTHCADLGMSDSTLRLLASYLLSIAIFLRLDVRPDDLISAEEIESQADRWANRLSKSGQSKPKPYARATFLSAMAQERRIPAGDELRRLCRGVFGFVLIG